MEDVIERLRASKSSQYAIMEAEMIALGDLWAKDDAEIYELELLEEKVEELREDAEGGTAIEEFCELIREGNSDQRDPGEFHRYWITDDVLPYERVKGGHMKHFAAGALKVWEEVKDKI